jgi:hypothetical protein
MHLVNVCHHTGICVGIPLDGIDIAGPVFPAGNSHFFEFRHYVSRHTLFLAGR